MRFGGWTRLGIVLSLAWFAAVLVWSMIDYNSNSRRDTVLIHWNDHKPKPWEIDWTEEELSKVVPGYVFSPDAYLRSKGMSQSEIDQLPTTPEVKWLNLLALSYLPPGLLWIIGLSVAWVHAGFNRSGKAHNGARSISESRADGPSTIE